MNSEIEVQAKVKKIVDRYEGDKSALIAILQEIQDEYRYLPKEALVFIQQEMDIPLSRVYEVATFYDAFSLKPRGRFVVEVCTGTACHVQGGINLLETLERHLRIQCGETTERGDFSLERVGCLGCCSLAPVIRVGDDIQPYLTQNKIPRILRTYMAKKQGRKRG
ncbi:MAG: NADH-quinone oxidoreductase subunit NuoE [Syntrophales bacterium]|jgi:NADH-quinone oxidoreductase subunit E|nr:NADH-quinone oxidoreductase subunit NuoE [Syntrophales bacterium]NLN60165.1 NADH-quinone oxidoreductase subunit NuoE [Deltaproteobacteria bacterium]